MVRSSISYVNEIVAGLSEGSDNRGAELVTAGDDEIVRENSNESSTRDPACEVDGDFISVQPCVQTSTPVGRLAAGWRMKSSISPVINNPEEVIFSGAGEQTSVVKNASAVGEIRRIVRSQVVRSSSRVSNLFETIDIDDGVISRLPLSVSSRIFGCTDANISVTKASESPILHRRVTRSTGPVPNYPRVQTKTLEYKPRYKPC